jgi:hypothetical protein
VEAVEAVEAVVAMVLLAEPILVQKVVLALHFNQEVLWVWVILSLGMLMRRS